MRRAIRMSRLTLVFAAIAGAALLAWGLSAPGAGAQPGPPASRAISVDEGVDFPYDM